MMEKVNHNSPDMDPEQVLVNLALGYRTPQNEYEEKMLKEIKEIEDEGLQVEIPSNGV